MLMIPRNSSAGIPLSTWMFLKTSSAISGFSADPAWPPANTTQPSHTTEVSVAHTIVRDFDFMLSRSLLAAAAAAGRRSCRWRRRRQRRLRSQHFCERGVGTRFVGIPAADADRADQLILDDDWQAPADEIIGEALRLAEVEPNYSPLDVIEALRHGAG